MTTFEMAISHFWRAQQATQLEDCAAQIAAGLQLFCWGIKESLDTPGRIPDDMFRMAMVNFWRAQNSGDLGSLGSIAIGLQQFCAAYKNSV